MAQVRLQCPGVGAPVRQRVSRGMAQHVRMHLERHLGRDPGVVPPGAFAGIGGEARAIGIASDPCCLYRRDAGR